MSHVNSTHYDYEMHYGPPLSAFPSDIGETPQEGVRYSSNGYKISHNRSYVYEHSGQSSPSQNHHFMTSNPRRSAAPVPTFPVPSSYGRTLEDVGTAADGKSDDNFHTNYFSEKSPRLGWC